MWYRANIQNKMPKPASCEGTVGRGNRKEGEVEGYEEGCGEVKWMRSDVVSRSDMTRGAMR